MGGREIAQQAQDEMWSDVNIPDAATTRHVHALARLLCDRSGLVWPVTRAAADHLLEQLRQTQA